MVRVAGSCRRATDRGLLGEIALTAAIGQVSWIPAWGEARIRGAVESRPDWCVSRQRSWGVPIPAFYDADKRAYLDAGVVRTVADKVATRGSNLWYDSTPAQILEGVTLPAGWPAPATLTCGRDTLDVWIDSGSSHAAVLRRGQGGTRWPADLYLEGSDQHRGWFQSSLWTSVIAFGQAPYKAVLTHGFIVDQERNKISKSSTYEKPQTSDAYINEYGADVIRLWIASQDFRDDIPISKEILSHVGETYRLIRNTFRYQLSTLFDFVPARDAVPVAAMHALDRWALHQAAALLRDCTAAYDACEFHRVYQLCNQFCSVALSATYHDILKDRLYTLAAGASAAAARRRRRCTTFFARWCSVLAPILAFTTDEAWSFAAGRTEYAEGSVHLQDWPAAPAWLESERRRGGRSRGAAARARSGQRGPRAPSGGGPHRQVARCDRHARGARPATRSGVARKTPRFSGRTFHRFAGRAVGRRAGPVPASPDRGPARQELGYARCPRCWRWVLPLESGRRRTRLFARCEEALRP